MSKFHQDLDFGVSLSPDQQKQTQKGQNKKYVQPQYQQVPQTNRNLANNNQNQIKLAASNYDLSASAHPVACIATFSFKAACVVLYFFGGIVFSSTIVQFILVVLMSAFDFWTVKNVTGRLLVGLRWWSDFDQQGKQIWRFQSYDGQFKTNAVDSAFFWTSQLLSTVFWGAWLIIKILGFSIFWSMVVFINASLSFTNLYGYYKCRGQHNKKLEALQGKLKRQGFIHIANKLLK